VAFRFSCADAPLLLLALNDAVQDVLQVLSGRRQFGIVAVRVLDDLLDLVQQQLEVHHLGVATFPSACWLLLQQGSQRHGQRQRSWQGSRSWLPTQATLVEPQTDVVEGIIRFVGLQIAAIQVGAINWNIQNVLVLVLSIVIGCLLTGVREVGSYGCIHIENLPLRRAGAKESGADQRSS